MPSERRKPSRHMRGRTECDHRGRGTPTRTGRLADALRVLLPGVLAVACLRLLVVGLYVVPTPSMADTVLPGDCVLGLRLGHAGEMPDVGDVVTFKSPESGGTTLVKRVVATEGQVVDVRGGALVVDGVAVEEPYVRGETGIPDGAGQVSLPHVVGDGCVWVMGDNREASRDSRWFGDVPVSSITSRALLVYWPPEDVGPIG